MTRPFSFEKNTNYYYPLIMIILLFGCSHEKESVELRSVDGELIGKEVPISAFIFKPSNIAIMDEMLVIHDRVAKDIFKFFSYPNVKYLFSWGKKGEGPDEIDFVHSTGFLAKDDTFSFVDDNVFKTYKIGYSNELSLVEKIYLMDTQGPLNDVNLLNDSLFIANLFDPLNPKSEYVFLHPNKKKGNTFGEFPDQGFEFDDYFQKTAYYLRRSVVNQDKKRIMVFYMSLNLIKLYNHKGRLLNEIEFNENSPSDKNINWRTFGHSFGTEKYAYVLYINEDVSTTEPESTKLFPVDLIVLNWEGEVVKRYDLNIPITDFVISEKHRKLYGITPFSGDKIFEFDLP